MTNNKFDELPRKDFSLDFDFDETKFNRILSKAKMDLDSVKEQALFELGCGEFKKEKFIANNACILFFALKPQAFVEQSCITCVLYHGNSMASVIDKKDLQGDLFALVDEAETFVKNHTNLAYFFDGFERVNIEEYPYEAIREAIINAVCHRNYFLNNNIFVNIFNDRIEVISPGSIPNDLSLKEVEGKSIPRNAIITNLFRKTDYVEKPGTGLKRMEELMLFHGLKKSQYYSTRTYFQVTFNGPKEKIFDLAKPSNVLDLRTLGLNERQIEILPYLQKHKFITSKEYAKKFGIQDRTARRDLEKLIKIGYVKKIGKSTTTKYSLEETLPAIPNSP